MAWISVHEDVNGPKLRRLAKELDCSLSEALGILNFLWFWGLRNADESGQVLYADRDDIAAAISPVTKIPAGTVVEALFSLGWIDDVDGSVYIHDWDTWQEQWYKYLRTKAYNAERKRKERSAEKARREQETRGAPPLDTEIPPEQLAPPQEPESPDGDKPSKPKKKPPEKKKYADFVKMTEANYAALVKSYGEEFTKICITELDLYKGSTGKTYKDDYRAILSWVVEKVNKKHPGLMRRSMRTAKSQDDGQNNPFAEWGDYDG